MDDCDLTDYLAASGARANGHVYQPGVALFQQGDPCEDLGYIQTGYVTLSMVSQSGRKRIVGTLGSGDFIGEGCLIGQPVRAVSATAIFRSTVVRVEKQTMLRLLRQQHGMSDRFIAHMLSRNIRIQEDLVDQLLNSAEERLARALVRLAGYGDRDATGYAVPRLSQETLAQMVGTTRSRVNVFLKRLRQQGHISRGGGREYTIHRSLIDRVAPRGLPVTAVPPLT